MSGYYSFVEDFKRDRVSTTKTRRAEFGGGWALSVAGKWKPLTKARFTADRNPVMNINAGKTQDRFFLATGGEIENSGTKLNHTIELPAKENASPPEDLLKFAHK